MSLRLSLFALLLTACTSSEQRRIEETILLTVVNDTGGQLWYFQYSPCGAEDWVEVIGADEYVANGDPVSSRSLRPGCYDLYVEDEDGCTSYNDTGGNLKAGLEFTWTVRGQDLDCYYFF
jgi:hypothetical protein